MQHLFRGMEGNTGLRTLQVKVYPPEDPGYSWLDRLLSRNRNITVLDRSGERCSNGPNIDNLYALNRFYQGSASLVTVSASLRPLLVVTALLERESTTLQRRALLLANHTDILCEFIDDMDLDDIVSQSVSEGTPSALSIPPGPNQMSLKRKAEIQPTPATKRVAENHEI